MKKLVLFWGLIFILCFAKAQVIPGLWQPTNGPNHQLLTLAISDSNIFASTWGYGIFLSSNYGDTWTPINTGLVGIVNSFAISGNNIFAGTYNPYNGEGHGVFLSTNNGSSWTAKNNGLTDTVVSVLAINGNNIFAGTMGGGMFLSVNNGNNWSPINNGLPLNIYIYSLAINGNDIFAGTDKGVYLSSNNGNSWSAMNNGLSNGTVNSLAINGSNIFAGMIGYGGGLYFSSDNGNSWTLIGLQSHGIYSLLLSGNNIFAGVGGKGGVYLSSDNGNTWALTGLTYNPMYFVDLYIKALVVCGNYILAGTSDGQSGVWKLSLAGLGLEEINNFESNIMTYPNPATDKIIIESQEKAVVQFQNIEGQIIKRLKIKDNKTDIDISGFTSGVYIIRVQTDKGIMTKKFIKE